MPLLLPDQRTDDWLEIRTGRVTASVAAACLGLDPHMSRAAAWRSILGERREANRHMRWGTEFEPHARADYECQSGNLVQTTGFWVHPEHDWLGASPDGLIDADGLVEIKCPTAPPAKVPVHHRIQMLVQLMVTERDYCDYFAWTMNNGSLMRRVVRPMGDGLLRALHRFYVTYVLTKTEPPRRRRRRTA